MKRDRKNRRTKSDDKRKRDEALKRLDKQKRKYRRYGDEE